MGLAMTGYARGIGASIGSTSASSSSYASLPNTRKTFSEPDRSMNLIVFGIAEHRDANVWRNKVDAAPSFVTGQEKFPRQPVPTQLTPPMGGVSLKLFYDRTTREMK